MLMQKMRDHTQGWIMWVLVTLLCLIFALWGVSYYIDSGSATKQVAAKVDGSPVYDTELQNAYQRARQQMGSEQVDAKALRKEVLQQLINQQLLVNAARVAGLSASNAQIDQLIVTMPAFQKEGKFSQELYQQILQRAGLTTDGLRLQLSRRILMSQLERGLFASSFILPNEQQHYQRLSLQKRGVVYTFLPYKKLMTQSKPSQQQMQAYYQAHQVDYTVPEKIQVAYVMLSVADIAKSIIVSDSELQAYYQQHKADYTKPEQRHIAQIVLQVPLNADKQKVAKITALAKSIEQKLRQGQSFSQLAKAQSDDSISAKKGGDIGWISNTNSMFDQAAFALKSVGSVSKPIRTKFGWQIIKLLAIKPAKIESFSQVKSKIRHAIQTEKAQRIYATKGNELANRAFENPGSLDFAENLGLQIKISSPFAKMGASGLFANKKVIAAAFSAEVMRGDNSDVINLSANKALVLRLEKKIPSHVLPLSSVRAQLVSAIQLAQAKQKTEVAAQQLLAKLKHQSVQQLTGYTWQHKVMSRNQIGVDAVLTQHVFSSVKSTPASVSNHQGIYVYQVTKILPGKATKDAVSSPMFAYLTQALLAQDYQYALRQQAKIVVNG